MHMSGACPGRYSRRKSPRLRIAGFAAGYFMIGMVTI